MNKLTTVLVLVLAATPAAWAAPLNVNSTDDVLDASPGDGICNTGGPTADCTVVPCCTLRAAIQEANALPGADSITVPSGTYSLTLTGVGDDVALSGDLDITSNLTLSGAGAASTVVDGLNADRVFDIRTGATATLSALTIRNGDSKGGRGGGIRNVATLTILDAIVTSNTDSSEGGGIQNDAIPASLTIRDSTISANTCPAGKGGGIHNIGDATTTFLLEDVTISGNSADEGGGIRNMKGTGTLTNVTVNGNSATAEGGGIQNRDIATMTLTNVTISGNTATNDGGGIQQQGTSAILTNVTITGNSAATGGKGGGLNNKSGTIQLTNSIIFNNLAPGDCFGTITSNGYNLDSDGSCGLGGIGDIPSGTANLGALADNGGSTLTHALLTGSQAIDAVLAGCPPPGTDQRGVVRPADGDGDLTATCDSGAYEAPIPLTISGTVFEDVNGDSGLGDAVAAGNVRVRLYEDINDNGQVDAGDTYLDEITTNATTGVYNLLIAAGSRFLVAVDSKTVPPSDGLNGGHAQGGVWAEQTYGDDPATPAVDVGARLGGRTAGTSDDVDAASTAPADSVYQHLARVDVSGGSVSGVDFAFSFRAVTHVGDNDDDVAEDRTAQGSLRQLIQNANAIVGAPSLDIPVGTYTLTLTGDDEDESLAGDLDVTDDVTLAGASASTTVIDGNRTDRVLDVFAASVEFADLTVEKGDSQGDHGGGILINEGSTLTMVDTMVRDNDGDRGGGIRVDGDLVMTGSTLYANRGSQGGAIQSSGSSQSVTMTNVTVSGNTASSRGGGLELDLTTLSHVTVTGSTSPDGGGIYRRGGNTFTVLSSIVAGNPSGGDCSNAFTSQGYNLDGDGTCALSGPGDISGGTANLGPLADNGGPTLTHALLAGSNAIDAVTVGCPPPAADQRGVARPIGLTCDTGAYEGVVQTLKIVKRAFQLDGTPIASGSTLPAGMPVKFMLYISNPGGLVADVSMRDALDPAFLYIAGSTTYANTVANCAAADCTPGEETAIFAAADSGTVGSDPVDGDVVSFSGVTLDIGNQTVANAQLDIAGGKVWAVVFTIRMQ